MTPLDWVMLGVCITTLSFIVPQIVQITLALRRTE